MSCFFIPLFAVQKNWKLLNKAIFKISCVYGGSGELSEDSPLGWSSQQQQQAEGPVY